MQEELYNNQTIFLGVKNLITSEAFQIIGLTVIIIILNIFVSMASNNEKALFRKSNFTFGLDLIVNSTLIYAWDVFQNLNEIAKDNTPISDRIIYSPFVMLLLVFTLWVTSFLVRKYGKDKDKEINLFAVLFPNIVGTTTLLIVFFIIH